MALRIFAGCPSLGHLSWARKKGDKSANDSAEKEHDLRGWVKLVSSHIENFTILFFSAPQFTAPRPAKAGFMGCRAS
jgi:hypothetical protein